MIPISCNRNLRLGASAGYRLLQSIYQVTHIVIKTFIICHPLGSRPTFGQYEEEMQKAAEEDEEQEGQLRTNIGMQGFRRREVQ